MPCRKPKSTGWHWNCRPSVLGRSCPLTPGQHAGDLLNMFVTVTILHWTVLGCGILFITGWAAVLFSLCCHVILIDHRLMQLSWQRAVWCRVKFQMVKSTLWSNLGHFSNIHSKEPSVHVQLLRADLSSLMTTTNMYVHVKYNMKVHTKSSEIHCIHSNRFVNLLREEVDSSIPWLSQPSVWKGWLIHTLDRQILE